MRVAIITLGVVALVSPVLAAQAPVTHRHGFLPAHKSRLSVDFGTKKALTRIAPPAPQCTAAKPVRHETPHRPAVFVELPIHGGHHVRPVPGPLCPVR
jgi:hypothetical protein